MPTNDPRRHVEWHESAPATESATNTIVGQPATVSDDVGLIIRRAAALGIPRWRVTTALGLPLSVEAGR